MRSSFLIDFKTFSNIRDKKCIVENNIKVHKRFKVLTKIQIQLTIFILSIEVFVYFH